MVEEPKNTTQSSIANSTWNLKDSKPVPKKNSLLGIVRTNKNKEGTPKPETVSKKDSDTGITETTAAPSGLGLLGAYSDSDNSD